MHVVFDLLPAICNQYTRKNRKNQQNPSQQIGCRPTVVRVSIDNSREHAISKSAIDSTRFPIMRNNHNHHSTTSDNLTNCSKPCKNKPKTKFLQVYSSTLNFQNQYISGTYFVDSLN